MYHDWHKPRALGTKIPLNVSWSIYLLGILTVYGIWVHIPSWDYDSIWYMALILWFMWSLSGGPPVDLTQPQEESHDHLKLAS